MILASLLFALQVGQGTPAAQSAQAPVPVPEIVNRARVDASKLVDVHAILVPDTVYVGQQATYQLGVFMESAARQRMRRNPEYLAPEVRDLLAYDLRDKPRGFVRVAGDRPYEVHVFRRALFALAPGTVEIPSARLTYTLPQGASFFSREESFTMRSEALRLVVIEPPAAGRPPEFRGAVGTYRVSAKIGGARAKAGDPIVLTLRVEGQGNVTLLPRPPLELSWGSVIAADERVSVDSQPAALRGAKEFDWIVTPRVAGTQTVPPIRFAFFNPFARRYEVGESAPIRTDVAVGEVLAAPATTTDAAPTAKAQLTIVREFDGERSLPFGQSAVYLLLLVLAPLPALVAFWRKRPRKAPRTLTARERLERLGNAAPSPGDPAAHAAQLRRALLDAIRERTGLDESRLTAEGAWERALALEGVTPDGAREASALLRELDAASFHAPYPVAPGLEARARAVFERIDDEARGRRVRRTRMLPRRARAHAILPALLLMALSPLLARTVDRARESFSQGVRAYDNGDFRLAARRFADAAREAPRSAAAWSDLGTASWAAADSANAVVGWQRALRLTPTDGALRDRLAATRAPQDVGAARVPVVPAQLPSMITLLVWVAGWAIIARRRAVRRPVAPLVAATLLAGAALMVTTARVERALLGRDLAIVVDPVPLRTLPALGAEAGPVPLAGETAQVDQRDGVWSHVVMDESRSGWIPTERLAPLGAP